MFTIQRKSKFKTLWSNDNARKDKGYNVKWWYKYEVIREIEPYNIMPLLTAFVTCILTLVSKILTSVVFFHVVETRFQQQGTWTSMSGQSYLWTSLNRPFQLHVAHGWESSPEKMHVRTIIGAMQIVWFHINATLAPPFLFLKDSAPVSN